MNLKSPSLKLRLNSSRALRSASPLLAAIVMASMTSSVSAAPKTWIAQDGASWSAIAAWSPSGAPVGGDDVTLGTSSATTANVTANFNVIYSPSSPLNSLTINPTGITGNFTLNQNTGGSVLAATTETIGSTTGRAFYNQTTGNNTASSFTLGNLTGSFGTYTLSGGNFGATNESIGSLGNGNFIQTGGINSIAINGAFIIGGTGSSSYSLSNGNISLVNTVVVIGTNALSTFNQASGNVTFIGTGANNIIQLGANPSGTGNYTLTSGAISNVLKESVGTSGNGTFTQNGGSNSFVSGGQLIVGENGVSGSFNSNGTYNLTSGSLSATTEIVGNSGTGTFLQTGGSNFTSNLTIAATSNGVGNYTLNSGTLTAVALTINVNGSFTQNGGTLSTSSITQNGGSIAGTLQNQNSFTYNSGTFSGRLVNNGSVTLNADFSPSNGILNNATFTIPLGLNVTVNGAGLDNESQFALNGGTLSGGGTIINNGNFSAVGTIAGTQGFTNNLLFTQGAGNILFSNFGTSTNLGTMTLASGRQFQISPSVTLTNSGTLLLNSAAVTGAGTLANAAGGVITGPGLITSVFSNSAIVQPGAATLNITNPWTNTGAIQLTSPSSTLVGATITNASFIQGQGVVSTAITNNGIIESIAGTLTLSGALTNNNTIRVAANSETLILGNFPTNPGIISLTGGTFENNGQTLTNTGQITGYGTLATGLLINNNAITFTGGTSTINGPVINSAGKTIIAKNDPAIFTGSVTNNGTIIVTNTTITFAGPYSGNAYISDPSTNIFQNNVTIIPAGSMSGGAGDTFIFSGPTFSNSGNFTNAGSLTASGNFTNTGTFTQSGPQTWTSNSSFTNASGTATFASNAKLYALTITAGTVDITTTQMIVEATTNKSSVLSALRTDIANHSLTSSSIPTNKTLVASDNAIRLTTFPTGSTNFGGINNADANSILLTAALKGDANLDGIVDIQDLTDVANHWQQPATDWSQGDFDNSNFVDISDLTAVANNWQAGAGSSSSSFSETLSLISTTSTPTPEPTSLTLLSLSTLLLTKRRRNTAW